MEERQRIIQCPPTVKDKTRGRYDEPQVKEVEDKLEKKKIMDQIQS